MYRRGPSKVTPAHVKCQKCLKTGHYSYECKATAQERPYIPRPSRTQQLLNPKLAPKLADAAPPELPKKQGVADQQLAKIDAERARKRDLEREDEESDKDEAPKRMRSASYDSVSTISTRGSPGPSRPVGRKASLSRSPARHDSRALPHSSVIDRDQGFSPNSAVRARDASPPDRRARRSMSPARATGAAASPSRGSYDNDDRSDRDLPTRRRGKASRSLSRSVSPEERRRYRSRSSDRQRVRHDNARERGRGEAGPGRHHEEARGPPPPRREQRERSLSPFSRRLAMTQTMNMNR